MIRTLLKKLITAFAMLTVTGAAFSLPAVNSEIKDMSGEYVYYLDKSFNRQVLIGVLYYNEETYALRYFCPASTDKKNPSAKKDITIYLTINPNNSGIELTGEKITGAATQEDADSVNYLHDIFYELTERRQKISFTEKDTFTSTQDYPQFGGNVNISFNKNIPVFNIESISSADGKNIFQVMTTGRLLNSSDTSFTDFEGIYSLPKDKKRNFKNSSKKDVTVLFKTQRITLDNSWTASAENFWLLGNSANVSFYEIDCPQNMDSKLYTKYLTRNICESVDASYSYWPLTNISSTENSVKVSNVFTQPLTGDVVREIKIITILSDSKLAFLKLAVFEDVYQKNRNYFTNIINTYSAQ